MEKRFCPMCGQPLAGGWRYQERTVYPFGASSPVTLGEGVTLERRLPSRPATVPGDVVVPLLQSAITGAVGGVTGAILGGWPGLLAGTGLTFGGTWLLLLRAHRSALWITERILGADLNRDGRVGRPNKGDPPIILNVPHNTRIRRDVASLTPDDLVDVSSPNRRLALDLTEFLKLGSRGGFGIRDWTNRTLSSGTRVTDGTWREWTGYLKRAGILESDPGGTRLAVDLDTALACILAARR